MKKWWYILVYVFITQFANAQITYENVFVDYDSAFEFRNLKVIPIRTKGPRAGGRFINSTEIISLQQGLRSGILSISERGTASTENVHWVRLTNKSNKPVFVGSGEILVGGRQDRMITKDTVLIPTEKDQYIPVMCVEEGRWSEKEKKFIYSNYANPRLRKVLDLSKNQVRIWKEISNQLDSNNITSPTLAYAAPHPDKKMLLHKDEYLHYFLDKFRTTDSSVVGFVCVSGTKIIGCDAFSGNNLFYETLDALLQGYIEEAIRFGDIPEVEERFVKTYMDLFMTDEKSQEQYLKKNGKLYKYNEKVFHLTAY